jgi:hypothetical protein
MFSETPSNDRELLKYEIVSMDSETTTTRAVMYDVSVKRSGRFFVFLDINFLHQAGLRTEASST